MFKIKIVDGIVREKKGERGRVRKRGEEELGRGREEWGQFGEEGEEEEGREEKRGTREG